ncbi:MAG: NUDIX hydrolase [Actinobacteria bacterium]|nr:NUDIX hydrolase [Actinomycetota bacterium]NIS32768.1 NUDIX hydrolase [Actinomycetota bacterium]NIT96433.1 NUDIX hydrolase [Actinomycetota bacterium]NIU20138.1 NUDIX hydrolase [Actinomycetota bacterium]NIU67751.1 NUDIX hydrolase [Actinomycetota bacterium]
MSDLRRRLARKYPQIEVWAAGGVVLRGVAGRPEVLLAHRPHRKDWSFPKGKLDPGETLGRAAEREVREETGLRCKRRDRLPLVRYRDGRGRKKMVVYWLMEVVKGEFEPNEEVDAVGWFDLASAERILTYDREARLLSALQVRKATRRMPA